MAGKTLQSEISKKQASINAEAQKDSVKKSQDLMKVIDYMAQNKKYAKDFTVKGFTKEEVMQAAKFVLQARPYDISVRHLDVEDSPIYYKKSRDNKRVSRGRLKRKDLDDAGKLLVKSAEAVALELEEEERQRQKRQLEDLVSGSGIMEIGEDIDEAEAAKLSEDREVDDYQSSKMIDDIFDNTEYAANLDDYYEGTSLKDKKTGDVKEDEGGNKYLKIIDSALDKKIPSLDELKKILEKRVAEKMQGASVNVLHAFNMTDAEKIEKLKPQKEKLIANANEILNQYKVMYDSVKKGELAPEVLKLFLNSALMNTESKSETVLYNKLMQPKEMIKPSQEEENAYRSTLMNLSDPYFKPPMEIGIQAGSSCTLHPYVWTKQAVLQKLLPKELYPKNFQDGKKTAFMNANSFIHYKPANAKETDKRIYITCKPNKEKALIEAWWKALDDYQDSKELYFKLGASPFYDRQEKIVIYIPNDKTVDDMKPLLNRLKEECDKNDVLADENNTLITGQMILPGIAFGVEPQVNILRERISLGWQNQEEKQDFEEMYKLTHPEKPEVKNNHRYSYNMYVNKALIMSCSIAKKKLNLKKGDKVSEHKAQIVPLMKKYFADFMKLAGADPKTLGELK